MPELSFYQRTLSRNEQLNAGDGVNQLFAIGLPDGTYLVITPNGIRDITAEPKVKRHAELPAGFTGISDINDLHYATDGKTAWLVPVLNVLLGTWVTARSDER